MEENFENLQENVTSQEDDYPTACLLDCPYFKQKYKLIAVDLSKQQVLDADRKAM